MIFTLIKKVAACFRRIFYKGYKVEIVEGEPEYVDDKIIYLIGDVDFHAIAVMLCPCGCKSKIHLNLIPGNKPTWSIMLRDKVPTINPSVWRKVGCHSHFFVRSGQIVWVKS
ncbi:DUF6527 family protein [Shewanella halotolerans]|uniref:DUF6527 family protein n=1 Tax=Shewanella halotolerans TaxID=2864204 RepID=UPI001C661BED|nr:DUF6527 family protein [Shewanella halotolerans]QYJ89673.1 hypothetical protein K0H81_18235 [Shewanella halotolerans]